MNTLEVPGYPPPPPPKRPDKPKITLQIPSPVQTTPRAPTTPSIYWGPTATKYYGKTPQTPASLRSDPHTNPYFNPFMHMYQNKASDFMFKQFEGFKDFTMNTAKSGLSAGEKSAFWFYNKLKLLSKKWFTHFFLTICLVLYSIMGAAMFMALEGPYEEQYDKNLTDVRREVASRIQSALTNHSSLEDSPDILEFIENDLAEYEQSFMEYLKHVNNNDTKKKTWSFWNAMFYAGTIYTTIDKHPDTEKHSCSLHKHSPVVGIETTALDLESRVSAHCATRPSKLCKEYVIKSRAVSNNLKRRR
ncbi:jg14122 [Pararge aegeria aegeria]|uniref:Jg14122 protein n=1 Tax=Pararge aegeria aegeria TaxID=348720 RepID=A0A8S4RYW4_9NEOP|nr:jg14122 [Pararge aegeria aegeria]